MITVKGLEKSFGQLEVLKGIDQHIAPGEKVVIIGPSGSGKSTFLRCLNLLERPTGGQILFEGTDITDPKCDINLIRRRMGMVFQQFNLFPHLNVMQNLTLAPIQTGQMSKEAATEKATQLLTRVGLLEKERGGPRRRPPLKRPRPSPPTSFGWPPCGTPPCPCWPAKPRPVWARRGARKTFSGWCRCM